MTGLVIQLTWTNPCIYSGVKGLNMTYRPNATGCIEYSLSAKFTGIYTHVTKINVIPYQSQGPKYQYMYLTNSVNPDEND